MFLFGERTKTRPLRELGVIALPSRLEPRDVVESTYDATFVFDHIYDSFFMMGSNTPVSEKLVLVFGTPSSDAARLLETAKSAADRTKVTGWRKDGAYLVGEGIHEVNAAKHPAWVIVRQDDSRSLVAAYMRWQKQASLADCKSTLDRALATLRLQRSISDYLKIAQDRPAQVTRENLDKLAAVLATRGVHITLDGPVQENAGIWYSLHRDSRYGPRFDALALLGDRPADRYRILHPAPPRGIGDLPDVCAFRWSKNIWTPDGEYLLPVRLAETMRQRCPDHTRSLFFAGLTAFPSDVDRSSAVETFWRALPFLKQQFEAGTLIAPL